MHFDFPRLYRDTRAEEGNDQGTFASKVNTARATLSKIELGKEPPPWDSLPAIALLAGIDPEFLITQRALNWLEDKGIDLARLTDPEVWKARGVVVAVSPRPRLTPEMRQLIALVENDDWIGIMQIAMEKLRTERGHYLEPGEIKPISSMMGGRVLAFAGDERKVAEKAGGYKKGKKAERKKR